MRSQHLHLKTKRGHRSCQIMATPHDQEHSKGRFLEENSPYFRRQKRETVGVAVVAGRIL